MFGQSVVCFLLLSISLSWKCTANLFSLNPEKLLPSEIDVFWHIPLPFLLIFFLGNCAFAESAFVPFHPQYQSRPSDWAKRWPSFYLLPFPRAAADRLEKPRRDIFPILFLNSKTLHGKSVHQANSLYLCNTAVCCCRSPPRFVQFRTGAPTV